MIGTVIGSLFIGIIINGLAFIQVSHLLILGVKGIVLIAVIALNEVDRRKPKYKIGQMSV
ncbi:hypothetical protein ES705_45496 [subsurface metagenome]